MCTFQRKFRLIMVESRRGPTLNAMTNGAIMIELRGNVVRIINRVIVGFMTGPAIRRCPGELTVNMTQFTGNNCMRTFKRESSQVVIESGGNPSIRSMTFQAVLTELTCDVIGIIYRIIICGMTGPAVHRGSCKLSVQMA